MELTETEKFFIIYSRKNREKLQLLMQHINPLTDDEYEAWQEIIIMLGM